MTSLLHTLGRIVLTLVFVAVAVVCIVLVWRYYEEEPRTQDGRILADVVQVAADVPGLVTRVLVRENQAVRAGDVLFEVDPERYTAKLASADASIANSRATLGNAIRERDRYLSLGDLVSREQRDQYVTAVRQAATNLEVSIANRRGNAIDLERSLVRARVDGVVSRMTLRPGDYVGTGAGLFALLDSNSFHAAGFFEETKLHRLRVGDRARLVMIGDSRVIWGHVESVAPGITNTEEGSSAVLLPNITPTFTWIRLAQRVPVRIAIDRVPDGLQLISGRTVSVSIVGPNDNDYSASDIRTNERGAVPQTIGSSAR